MRTTIKLGFFTTFKLIAVLVLSAFTSQVYAEYYVVYSETMVGGCPGSGCYTAPAPCNTCKVYPSCYRKKCKRYKTVAVRKRHRAHYNLVTYYVWPTYTGSVWVPKCGGDCVRWVPRYCDAPSCDDFYVPAEYIVPDPPMDMRTSDDF